MTDQTARVPLPAPAPAPVVGSRARVRLRARLWLLSALFIVYGTTIPFDFVTDGEDVLRNIERVRPSPFVSPDTGRRVPTGDVIQNVVLFLPFGFLAAATGRWRAAHASLAAAATLGAFLSGAVETLQLFTRDRTTSLADLCANTAGAALGAVMWPGLRGLLRTAAASVARRNWNAAPAAYPLLLSVLLIVISTWEPLDPTLDIGALRSKLKSLLQDPWGRSALSDEPLHAVRYALATALGVLWGMQRQVPTPRLRAAAAFAAASLLLEGSQIFIGARMPSGQDLFAAGAGIAAGALLPGALFRAPVRAAAALAAATALAAGVLYLSPFTVAAARRPVSWLPFLGYYEYTSSRTVSHVMQLVLCYAPIGFAVSFVRPTWSRRALLLVIGIAGVLEFLQGWVVGRFPDATDVGVAALGCAAGAWLAGPGASLWPVRS